MNTPTTTLSSSLTLQKTDRVGVAASVLCAIHCALAPILLIALPSFGRIWAHPASHLLVAIFVVPLAIFSIRKGYRTHKKRWILMTASIGIFFVLIGAMLPALTKGSESPSPSVMETATDSQADDSSFASAPISESSEAEGEVHSAESACDTATGCVNNCCPSLQVDANGNTSLHIPPAAIVTTLGGIFLITAHIGNLCSCGHARRTKKCLSCA